MIIALAQAYNGIHKIFRRHFKNLGADTFYFNIDKPDWFHVVDKKPDAYFWFADNKEERYREIYDRVYFIEKILRKPILMDMNMYFAEGDKLKQWQILSRHQIPLPKTFIAADKQKAGRIITKIKYPFVLKDPYGYGGHHVFKVDDIAEANRYINKIFSSKGMRTKYSTCHNIFYAQEFIPADRDLRVITIGGRAACAYWRVGKTGEWRHNIEQGAHPEFSDIPRKALQMAENFSRAMKFHWMGFDFLRDNKNNIKMIEYSANVRVHGALAGGYDIRRQQAEYAFKYFQKFIN